MITSDTLFGSFWKDFSQIVANRGSFTNFKIFVSKCIKKLFQSVTGIITCGGIYCKVWREVVAKCITYYEVWQECITHSVTSGITKCDKNALYSVSGIAKCDKNALHSVTGITKCDKIELHNVSGTTKCNKN